MRVAIGDRHFTVDGRALPRPRYRQSACACRWRRCTCSQAPSDARRNSCVGHSQRPLPPTALAWPAAAQQTLNVVTAGDQNMVDYVKDYLGPKFEKIESRREGARGRHRARATPARRRSTRSSPRSRRRGAATWDFDVVVIHQKAAGTMVERGPARRSTRDKIATGKLVTARHGEERARRGRRTAT